MAAWRISSRVFSGLFLRVLRPFGFRLAKADYGITHTHSQAVYWNVGDYP